jgi:hypothetical protein
MLELTLQFLARSVGAVGDHKIIVILMAKTRYMNHPDGVNLWGYRMAALEQDTGK